jgi:NADP-dependent 3-hydroxy acid dehydrogenase YdfG
MLESLQNKVAWITGAGTGIGQAAAVALAKNGANVILSGRRIKALQETADIIAPFDVKASLEVLDVSDQTAVQTTADRIISSYGRLDILVNNAGTNIPDRHWSMVTPRRWNQVIDINLNGAFYCARAVLPIMRKQQDGLIINVSSWAGRFYSHVTGPAYSAAKYGLMALNASINMEEFTNGIRACAICPGEVATPILDQRPEPIAADVKARMLKSDDLGETILFVAHLPRSVCINEILISPTWNRSYVADLTPKT